MKASIFLVVLCLGIASAVPAVDQGVHAEPNELLKDIVKAVVQAIVDSVIKTAIENKPVSLQTEVNVPADEIAEEFQAGDVVIPEAVARKLEKAIEDILVAMGLVEDSKGAPVMRK